MMTILDILLVVGFLGFLWLGFAQGVVKVLFVIVATYVALLLGATIYQPTASWLAPFILGKNKPSTVGFELIVFFVIVLVAMLLLSLFLFTSFRYAALPNSLAAIDRVGGMVLGAVLGVLVLSIVVLFLQTAGNVAGGTDIANIPVIGFAVNDVQHSRIAGVLLDTRDVIKTLVSPVVNTNNNPLFTPGLNGA